jgi:hypothetical protein
MTVAVFVLLFCLFSRVEVCFDRPPYVFAYYICGPVLVMTRFLGAALASLNDIKR